MNPAPPAPPVPTPDDVLGPAAGPLAPPPRRRRRPVLRALLAAGGLLVLVALGFVLGVTVLSETGATGFVLGLALALVPVPVVVAALMWVDRYEPEPPLLLVVAFLWGAVVAATVASVLNTVSLVAIAQAAGQEQGMTTTAVVVAPVVEEGVKGLGVLAVVLFVRKEFDGVVDGIVVGGTIGLGFAVSENVLYYGRSFVEAGPQSGLVAAGVTFVLRGVFSPFAHPLFTACTGIGLGLAATARRPATRVVAPVVGYLCAVVLHSLWNQSAVQGLQGFVAGYVLLMLPLFLVAVVVAVLVSRREGRAIARALPLYAQAGWLPVYDVPMVASTSGRRRARRWADSTQGPVAARAMADYQHAAAELGLLRDRVERGAAAPAFAEREHDLLRDLARARTGFRPVLR